MPTANGSGSDEVESQDEVKVFKYEGEEEDCEKSSSENLHEDKNSLITETEEDKSNHASSSSYPMSGPKLEGRLPDAAPFGIFGTTWGAERLAYYSHFAFPPYTNGTSPMFLQTSKEMGFCPGSPGGSLLTSLYHNGQHHFSQPPPAHMGISPYQLDPKSGYEGRLPMLPHEYSMSVAGLRYPFATSGQYNPYSLTHSITPELTAQMASAWFNPGGLMPSHAGLTPPLSHPLVPSPKIDIGNASHDNQRHLHNLSEQKNSLNNGGDKSQMLDAKNGEKKPHIKKPLNAFMLYMKEMRAKVVAECTLKESAAINQILGRRWHALSKEEQAKYYDMARRERQIHMQMHPGWNARDNYGMMKKKKRKKEKASDGANMKKCRARYGVDQQSQWCKPCRRKKKCARYSEDGLETAPCSAGSLDDMNDESDLDDNLNDVAHSITNSLSGSSLTMMDHIGGSPGSSLMLSPGPSLSSPCAPSSLLMASPASMASPMTPGDMAISTMEAVPPPVRAPVGTNPRDVNNPLSVNQLTGQCANTSDPSRMKLVRVT